MTAVLWGITVTVVIGPDDLGAGTDDDDVAPTELRVVITGSVESRIGGDVEKTTLADVLGTAAEVEPSVGFVRS
eukprot:2002725-Rhodomonas_salina.1